MTPDAGAEMLARRRREARCAAELGAAIAEATVHVGCGAALVATLALPWTESGDASLLTGGQLAGFLLASGHRLSALAIYAVAVGGCLVIAAAASRHVLVRGASALLAASVAAGLVAAAALGSLPAGRWGPAPPIAAAAAAAVFAVDVRSLLRRARERRAGVS